jgi:hypothetical protein
MDIPKPGIAGSQSPFEQGGAKGPSGPGGGGSGGKFADVLSGAGPQGAAGPGAAQPGQGSPFSSPILDPDLPGAQRVGGIKQKPKVSAADTDMRAQKTPHALQSVGELAGKAPNAVEGGQLNWQKVANSAVNAENRLDSMINAAQKGKTFSANELIALQVEVFRYSQTVEVISRTTDKIVGAVKQTLGTQV